MAGSGQEFDLSDPACPHRSGILVHAFLGAVATSLVCVVLSSPTAFANGKFGILTGAPLVSVLTSAPLMLACVVPAAAAIGFQLLRNRAVQARASRRFQRGRPPPSGRVWCEAMSRYPPAPPLPGLDTA
jgi:hypothetical protein